MSFAVPSALLLAALAVPIVALYVLRVRMRQMPVSTNLFWQQIHEEKPPTAMWQQLRHVVSLLMQLAFLSLLVLAIADPQFAWRTQSARHIVLVIDNSASMQATDVAPSRLAAAIDQAHSVLTGLRDQDQAAIIVAGKTPEVVVGMTGHLPTLRRALDGITPSDGHTNLTSSVQLGTQLVESHEHGQVIVYSDRSESDQAAKNSRVVWEVIGTEANNLGITQLQTRRSLVDPLGYEILVSVSNASNLPVEARLEITLDDIPLDIIPLKLTPNERWSTSLEKASIDGGVLMARLTNIQSDENRPANQASVPRNQLATDDVAYAILPKQTRQRVLLVTPGNFFLQKVFQANPLVDLTVRNDFPETWPTEGLIVLHRNTPPSIPAGNVWVIDPASDCDLWKLRGSIQEPIIAKQDEDSPLMTHVSLENILLPSATAFEWNTSISPLAETASGDAIFAELTRPSGNLLVLGVNLESSDLAFRTAFPIMATNSLSWLAKPGGELHPSLSTDQFERLTLPAGSLDSNSNYVLSSPRGNRIALPTNNDSELSNDGMIGVSNTNIGPLSEVGVWQVLDAADEGDDNPASRAEPIRQIAVNLASAEESDIRVAGESDASVFPSSPAVGWWYRPIWFFLVLLGCLFSVWEWFAYQRRVIS